MTDSERIEEIAPEIEELQARVAAKPDELEPILELAWAQFGRGQTKQAIENFIQADQKHPENPEINYALGLAHKRAGDQREARGAFENVVRILQETSDGVRPTMMLTLAKRQLKML